MCRPIYIIIQQKRRHLLSLLLLLTELSHLLQLFSFNALVS